MTTPTADPAATGRLQCKGCKRVYVVPGYLPNRRYKCAACMQYLELMPDPPVKGDPSPSKKIDPFEGKLFGKYKLGRRLGRGGMGLVYLGEDTETRQQAAVKILTEQASRMPGIQKRFAREGSAGERLEHPNIVQTYGMGQQDTLVFLATEFVEGGSLEDLVFKEKKIAPLRVASLIADVLTGLQHAHDKGVVHRDIKPANILLTADGRAKVIDFGLAMDAEAETILTLTGTVMGTPSFMSPEQAQGDRGTGASDQYACGLVAWYALTGKKPFEGKGVMEILYKQASEPLPSARALNPEVPEALEKVLVKMAAKDPVSRYPSAMIAAQALKRSVGLTPSSSEPASEAKAAGEAAASRPGAKPPSRALRIAIIVIGVLAIGAALAWRFLAK